MRQRRQSLRNVAEEKAGGVPASRWGVTKAQFIEFVDVVRCYQARGLLRNIPPPSLEPKKKDESAQALVRRNSSASLGSVAKKQLFSKHSVDTPPQLSSQKPFQYPDYKFNDPNVGPTIYQINHQIIKPITKGTLLERLKLRRRYAGYHWDNLAAKDALPKSSWALMKNPSGVDIDLFVSHAWAEGIYEFANHLLSEWPHECQAAYICFLSNPQNLDKKLYLGRSGNLQDNAFYKALQSNYMKQMVIISTQNVPIHRRAWCCFEAYVALQQNIPATIGGDKRYLSTMRERVREYRVTKELERQGREIRMQGHLDYLEHKVEIHILLFCFKCFCLGVAYLYFSGTDLRSFLMFVAKSLVKLVAIIAFCIVAPVMVFEERKLSGSKVIAAPVMAVYHV
ncbi:expressed unknown protein (Partial), partial [Seminavis robusta]|eukprot:Sro2419_g327120.1 n/a (395) ;mRNA; f:13612-14796